MGGRKRELFVPGILDVTPFGGVRGIFGPYMVTMLFVGFVLITLDRLLRLLFFCWWYADIPGPNFGPSI
jgi:hypothetical protein